MSSTCRYVTNADNIRMPATNGKTAIMRRSSRRARRQAIAKGGSMANSAFSVLSGAIESGLHTFPSPAARSISAIMSLPGSALQILNGRGTRETIIHAVMSASTTKTGQCCLRSLTVSRAMANTKNVAASGRKRSSVGASSRELPPKIKTRNRKRTAGLRHSRRDAAAISKLFCDTLATTQPAKETDESGRRPCS